MLDRSDRRMLCNWGMGAETLDALDQILRGEDVTIRGLVLRYIERVAEAVGEAAVIRALGSASPALEEAVKAITGTDDWTR